MKVQLDKNQLMENEALNMRITFSGNGNLKLIQKPKIDFPPDFDVYDPKISNNLNYTVSGATGSKTFDVLAIPRHAGTYRIPPVEFTHFDPAEKRYKTVRSDEFSITVTKDSENEEGAIISGFSKEDLRFIGSDIRFIKNKPFRLHKKNKTLFGSLPFILSYLIALVIFGSLIVIRRNQIKRNADHALVRNRKANKIARKRLKQANSHLKAGEISSFYESLLKAFWGYLGDKLSIPVADLSKEKSIEMLQAHNAPEEMISEFFDIIDRIEFARFAPSEQDSNAASVFDKAAKIITKFEQNLR
jgi:hypothetical protein